MSTPETTAMNPDSLILADGDFPHEDRRGEEAQPIGDILALLLARYRAQYPELSLSIVEPPATAD